MAKPWIILGILSATLVAENGAIEITVGADALNVTETNSQYYVYMNENNHNFTNGQSEILQISGMSTKPTVTFFGGNSFSNTIGDGSETNTYTLLATQYFDYDTAVTNVYYFYLSEGTDISNAAVVILEIQNIDDEPPQLSNPMCTFDENTIYTNANSSCTCTLTDVDGWLSQTTFEIVDNTGNESKIFDFEFRETPADSERSATVYVTVKEMLDYETTIFYSFNVKAQDGYGHPTTPNEEVRTIVYVNDLNDMPPEFTNYFTTTQFDEEQAMTFSVTARDGDKGIDAYIYYKINYTDSPDYVSISESTGEISVLPIDRDAKDITTYQFTVVAFENDSLPYFETPLNITFFIQDIDDNDPLVMRILDSDENVNQTFTQSHGNEVNKTIAFNFDENYDSSLNGIIEFQDIDTGTNAQFTVALEDLEESTLAYTNAFLIAPTAGYRSGTFQISVRNATYLDYEDPPWINFQFRVHSYGLNTSREDSILISISLNDINDELPIFAESEYSVSINETLGREEFIIQVMATDKDYVDRVLQHTLVGSNVITRLLRIDSETGEIYVQIDNAFDYDTINPIFVQVRATDHANHTTTVPVTINLLDVNNKSPTITVTGIIEVDENQKKGAVLNTSIVASDVDTTRNLTALINWDNSYAMKNSRRLDMTNETIRQHVEFLDLTHVETGNNGDIEIELTVNSNIPTEETPDFELFDSLFLNITVTDLNTDPEFIATNQNTSALILISIGDLNDNWPIFTDETKQANRTVSEGALANVIVGSILATDLDVGDIVTYSCKALDENFDWFTVNSASGVLTVKENNVIDADTQKTYYVNYTCSANDSLHVTNITISIYILDTNNQWPTVTINSTVSVVEKSPEDTEFSKISTSDLDRDPPFYTVECSFDRQSDCFGIFTIDATNVLKVGSTTLDRDRGAQNYSCAATCTDNPDSLQNGVQNQREVSFTVKLLDINDNAPELLTFELSGSENLSAGEEIGKILAKDIDEGANATIDFHILHVWKNGDEDGIDYVDLLEIVKGTDYEVNETHKIGTFKALEDLKNYYGTYIVHLNLTDQGTPVMFIDNYTLTLEIERYNYFTPEFLFPGPSNSTLVLQAFQEIGTQLLLYRNNEALPDFSVADNENNTCSGKWEDTMTMTIEQLEPTDNIIFIISQTSNCSAQLRVNNNYDTQTAIKNTYQLRLTTTVKDGTEEEGEESYSSTFDFSVSFFDNTQDPVFTYRTFEFGFLEDNITVGIENDTQTLPEQATYQNIPDGGVNIFYFLVSSNLTISNLFNVAQSDGSVSHTGPLDYLTDKEFTFRILASNQAQATTNTENSYLTITVNVIDINNHSPQWALGEYYGAIMTSYTRGTTILTVSATDLDEIDDGKLTYSIVEDSLNATGTGLSSIQQDAFVMADTTSGEIRLNFVMDNTMKGYFTFEVQVKDVEDEYGNPAHQNTTTVTIFMITSDNTVNFRFGNTLQQVLESQQSMLSRISNALGYECHAQNIDWDSQDGVQMTNQTVASIYCVNGSNTVDASTIQRQVSNVNTFMDLKNSLLLEDQLWLMNFDSEAVAENTETLLRAWLVGVSVVLGALCVILLVTFILKIRELNRRITKLTSNKFGSQESGLNRLGISAPTANKRAVEGSNPVFNTEVVKNRDIDMFDRTSVRSGDSDLIGIEDSPEFDYFDNKDKERF